MSHYVHRMLDCGLEFAAEVLADRRTVAVEFQILSGLVDERPDKLGMAHLLEQTMSKGTRSYDARGLADAFDRIGARRVSWAGRETYGFRCLCLPEFLPQAVELHAEMLCRPTFPDDACRVAVELTLQDLEALEDEPGELVRKLLARQSYGRRLGRHYLGERATVSTVGAEDIRAHWSEVFGAGRLQVAVAGPVQPERLTGQLEQLFADFGRAEPAGREPVGSQFLADKTHCHKELEQQYMVICWPGASVTDGDYPVERVVLGILSGGMSGRLFTEVREKQGLVYWVAAWHEHPRGAGMMHVGASSTPQRCEQTLAVLKREVDRLAEDLRQDELDRAIVGIVARTQTRGEVTQARVADLSDDLFYYGRPVPIEQKLRDVQSVTIDRVKSYLARFARDELSMATVGPRELD